MLYLSCVRSIYAICWVVVSTCSCCSLSVVVLTVIVVNSDCFSCCILAAVVVVHVVVVQLVSVAQSVSIVTVARQTRACTEAYASDVTQANDALPLLGHSSPDGSIDPTHPTPDRFQDDRTPGDHTSDLKIGVEDA